MFLIQATLPLNDDTKGFRFNYFGIKGLTRKRKTKSRGDRKSVVQGKSVDLGGRRIIKKKKEKRKKERKERKEKRMRRVTQNTDGANTNGGGGWGRTGENGGGAGGDAINTGYSYTYTNNGTVYGSV